MLTFLLKYDLCSWSRPIFIPVSNTLSMGADPDSDISCRLWRTCRRSGISPFFGRWRCNSHHLSLLVWKRLAGTTHTLCLFASPSVVLGAGEHRLARLPSCQSKNRRPLSLRAGFIKRKRFPPVLKIHLPGSSISHCLQYQSYRSIRQLHEIYTGVSNTEGFGVAMVILVLLNLVYSDSFFAWSPLFRANNNGWRQFN
jgi:hypothetical protein